MICSTPSFLSAVFGLFLFMCVADAQLSAPSLGCYSRTRTSNRLLQADPEPCDLSTPNCLADTLDGNPWNVFWCFCQEQCLDNIDAFLDSGAIIIEGYDGPEQTEELCLWIVEQMNLCNSDPDGCDIDEIYRQATNVIYSEWCLKKVPPTYDRDACLNEAAQLLTEYEASLAAAGFAGGDPHFQLWNGNWFDFHGGCDLVLIQAPEYSNGLGMDIHVRTRIRQDYSYIESAAVQIGSDVLEVGSYGDFALNGVTSAKLPVTLKNGAVISSSTSIVPGVETNREQYTYTITLEDGYEVVLKSFKDLVSVKVPNEDLPGKHLAGSSGMLGHFSKRGSMVARDGVRILKDFPDDFGMEWQVRDNEPKLFRTAQRPQYPEECAMPTTSAAKDNHRRLGEALVRRAAEDACSHWGDTKDMCIFDVMATRDFDHAKAGPY